MEIKKIADGVQCDVCAKYIYVTLEQICSLNLIVYINLICTTFGLDVLKKDKIAV